MGQEIALGGYAFVESQICDQPVKELRGLEYGMPDEHRPQVARDDWQEAVHQDAFSRAFLTDEKKYPLAPLDPGLEMGHVFELLIAEPDETRAADIIEGPGDQVEVGYVAEIFVHGIK